MRKILITGGSGFIGSAIVNMLAGMGESNITVIDSMNKQIHGGDWKDSFLYKSINGKCNFIKGSVTDLSMIQQALSDNEIIIHLAAETGTGQSMYQINEYNNTNIMGLSNLLQAISLQRGDRKVKKVILASSRAVYGEGKYECPNCGVIYPKGRNRKNLMAGDFDFYCNHCKSKLKVIATNEDDKINPLSLYAYTKYAQEQMLQTMCPALGIDFTIFRFQNVYGVGQSLKNPYTGILSVFSSLMLENKDINVFENGLESRDFVYVDDVASAVISCFDNELSSGEIFNIGSGISTSVIEIAEKLKEYYNSKSNIQVTGDFRVGDVAHNRADINKAKKILGFEAKISLNEGLKQFCSWVQSQDIDNGKYEKSLIEMENAGMFIRSK